MIFRGLSGVKADVRAQITKDSIISDHRTGGLVQMLPSFHSSFTEYCTLHSAHCTIHYTAHCVVHFMYAVLYTALFILPHNVLYTLCTPYCTM